MKKKTTKCFRSTESIYDRVSQNMSFFFSMELMKSVVSFSYDLCYVRLAEKCRLNMSSKYASSHSLPLLHNERTLSVLQRL